MLYDDIKKVRLLCDKNKIDIKLLRLDDQAFARLFLESQSCDQYEIEISPNELVYLKDGRGRLRLIFVQLPINSVDQGSDLPHKFLTLIGEKEGEPVETLVRMDYIANGL